MKRTIIFITILFLKSVAFGKKNWTAQVNVTILNFNSVTIERFTFFDSQKDITVEKNGINSFLVRYFGDKPALYNINFQEVLITPGDVVNLVCSFDRDKFTFSAVGTHAANYTYYNYLKGQMNLPAILLPDINLDKFKKNTELYCNILESIYNKWSANTIDSINKFQINDSLKNYLKRKEHFKLLSKLMNIAEYENEKVGQMPVLLKRIDSLFLNTHFVETDTTYAYYSEFVFKNYFSCIIKNRYHSLTTEKEFLALTDYIMQFPNAFIKQYFVYFLATDYKNLSLKYSSNQFTEAVSRNPFMGRQRYIFANTDHIYWLNN